MYDPIAIIGMGCRFPGGANSPKEFWKLLINGVDAISDVPKDRWSADYYYAKDRVQPGGIISKQAGFLDDIKGFDHAFFGISSMEANNIDPQQRLTLQVAWEAFEQGGLDITAWKGRSVGVYMGCFSADYQNMQFLDPLSYSAYSATGIMNTMLSNRLSYAFDFRGPSMSIDTACSASLSAVHQACISLQRRESDLVLAGGALLMLIPDFLIAETKTGLLSKDSRCKSFSAEANGYVRSEGVGIVVLKRLEDALRDKDIIQSVIIGSALNQDGHTNNITLPNGDAQMEVMRTACRQAGINPADVDYVEAHGTGTSAGDPIEAKSIGTVFRNEVNSPKPLLMGSCKSNIGHTESAAGIAGLIKTVLCLQNRKIPPSLHSTSLNPHIDFDKLCLKVPQKAEELVSNKKSLIAGLNSFGFGGTNAHFLLQEAPIVEPIKLTESKLQQTKPYFLPLSAQSHDALIALAKEHRNALGKVEEAIMNDWCFSAAKGRAYLSYRKMFIGRNRQEIIADLNKFIQSDSKVLKIEEHKKMSWVYSGLGVLTYGMSTYLFENEFVFRNKYLECEQLYQKISGISLLNILAAHKKEDPILDDNLAHPAVFFHQVSTAALWESRGIKPDTVLGHSVGEFASFYQAGIHSLEDYLKMIFSLTELLKKVKIDGAMLAVAASAEKVKPLMAIYENSVFIAAYNSANQIMLSGKAVALKKLKMDLRKHAIPAISLGVNKIFHNRSLLDEVEMESLNLYFPEPQKPLTELYSTLNGDKLEFKNIGNDHWIQNLTRPVLFEKAIDAILKNGQCNFLEISSRPSLIAALKSFNPSNKTLVLNRKSSVINEDCLTIATIYEAGFKLDFENILPAGKFIEIPTYQWQNVAAWFESEKSMIRRLKPMDGVYLGSRISSETLSWEALFSLEKIPWLNDYTMLGEHLLPGSTYVDMMLAALDNTYPNATFVIENLQLKQSAKYTGNATFFTKLEIDDRKRCIKISASDSLQSKALNLVAESNYRLVPRGHSGLISIDAFMEESLFFVSGKELYSFFTISKHQYGNSFQGINKFYVDGKSSLCEILVPKALCSNKYQFHPIVLEVVFQSALACKYKDKSTPAPFEMLAKVDEIRVFSRPKSKMYAKAVIVEETEEGTKTDIEVYDEYGNPVISVIGFRTLNLSKKSFNLSSRAKNENYLSKPHWEKYTRSNPIIHPKPQSFIILGNKKGFAKRLCDTLESQQHQVVIYEPKMDTATSINQQAKTFVEVLKSVDEFSTIIHCLALEADTTTAVIPKIAAPILSLAKAIRETNFKGKCWFLSQFAQVLDGHLTQFNPFQKPLWGIARVFHQEFSENKGGIIDIDSGQNYNFLSPILDDDEIAENQYVFRGEQSYVFRLKPYEKSLPKMPPSFSENHGYFIAGAFGAIGKVVTAWMVSKNAKNLVLTTSRTIPPIEEWHKHNDFSEVLSLREKGIKIELVQVDFSKKTSVNALKAKLDISKIRGIMYCVGLVDDEVLEKLSSAQLRKVVEVKLVGSWALHELFKPVALEHFVLFSSVASCTPNYGTGNYALANTCLDALAQYRQNLGMPALSINWGAWSIGMVKKLGLEKLYVKLGIGCFQKQEGISVLETVFNTNFTQIIAQKMDWPLFLSGKNAEIPSFNYFKHHSDIKKEKKQRYESADEIKVKIIQEVTDMLNMNAGDIDINYSLMNYGLDSLSTIILADMIKKEWGVEISVDDFQDDLSIEGLLEKILFEQISDSF